MPNLNHTPLLIVTLVPQIVTHDFICTAYPPLLKGKHRELQRFYSSPGPNGA